MAKDVYELLQRIIADQHHHDDERTLSEVIDGELLEIGIADVKNTDYFVCKFDNAVPRLYPFLREESGVQAMCDYIIFACRDEKLYTLLIELKAGNKQSDYQLEAGRVLVHFLLCTVMRLLGREDTETYLTKIRIANMAKKRSGRKEPLGYVRVEPKIGYCHIPKHHVPLMGIMAKLRESKMSMRICLH